MIRSNRTSYFYLSSANLDKISYSNEPVIIDIKNNNEENDSRYPYYKNLKKEVGFSAKVKTLRYINEYKL